MGQIDLFGIYYYNDVEVQHVSHYATAFSPRKLLDQNI